MLRNGMFSPGEALREVTLANQLGVSRGPIREAFRSLEEKGLVKVEKNRGVFVRVISVKEADEIFEVRTTLEKLIVFLLLVFIPLIRMNLKKILKEFDLY